MAGVPGARPAALVRHVCPLCPPGPPRPSSPPPTRRAARRSCPIPPLWPAPRPLHPSTHPPTPPTPPQVLLEEVDYPLLNSAAPRCGSRWPPASPLAARCQLRAPPTHARTQPGRSAQHTALTTPCALLASMDIPSRSPLPLPPCLSGTYFTAFPDNTINGCGYPPGNDPGTQSVDLSYASTQSWAYACVRGRPPSRASARLHACMHAGCTQRPPRPPGCCPAEPPPARPPVRPSSVQQGQSSTNTQSYTVGFSAKIMDVTSTASATQAYSYTATTALTNTTTFAATQTANYGSVGAHVCGGVCVCGGVGRGLQGGVGGVGAALQPRRGPGVAPAVGSCQQPACHKPASPSLLRATASGAAGYVTVWTFVVFQGTLNTP